LVGVIPPTAQVRTEIVLSHSRHVIEFILLNSRADLSVADIDRLLGYLMKCSGLMATK